MRFRLIKRRRQLDEAILVDVLTASPDRVAPPCAHFGVCGGCSLQHLSPPAQIKAKERQLLDNLQRIGRVNPERVLEPLLGPEWGYRRRARLGVKYVHKKGRVLAGFREREKPYLADLRRCEVLEAPLADLPRDLAALVETLDIREKSPGGGFGRRCGDRAGDARAGGARRRDVQKIADFGAKQGVQIFLQTGGLDSVRPLLPDYSPLSYALDAGRVIIEFGPVDFIQVNRAMNASMVAAAMDLLLPARDDAVLDLFCGLGNFTLPLARRAQRVVGVEGDAALIAKARANASRNGAGNAAFFMENLFEPAHSQPGRTSAMIWCCSTRREPVHRALLARMADWRPRQVVYISCHPGSLARDAEILVHGQGFKLTCAGVMDMFPHTTHVESIAVFEGPA